MADPFLAEIRIFGGNFAPRGFAFCNGQLLPIAQNTALFSLLGTTYGGDGRTTFGIPDLQGRIPMGPGRGPGLVQRRLGERGGQTDIALPESAMPNHGHTLRAADAATTGTPSASARLASPTDAAIYRPPTDPLAMAGESLAASGDGAPHHNRQPYLALNFIIAVQGLYPSRS